MNYYNEFDRDAAAWLRELIAAGEIPAGDVDERSIEDVKPNDLSVYDQCHFFAGIGGWPLALRLAGIPDDYPIWTGSCPCQPFSSAGKGGGFDDERHLWPAFNWLIAQCQPAIVAGEQVASKAAGTWLDLVQVDLETMGYAFGAVAFPAASVGAPHIRDRTYWVGYRECKGLEGFPRDGDHQAGRSQQARPVAEAGCACELADNGRTGSTNGHWRDADWRYCRDRKWRPVEPGTFPLVNGLPRGVGYSGDPSAQTAEARVMRIKGY